jgi:hypothetical protein
MLVDGKTGRDIEVIFCGKLNEEVVKTKALLGMTKALLGMRLYRYYYIFLLRLYKYYIIPLRLYRYYYIILLRLYRYWMGFIDFFSDVNGLFYWGLRFKIIFIYNQYYEEEINQIL